MLLTAGYRKGSSAALPRSLRERELPGDSCSGPKEVCREKEDLWGIIWCSGAAGRGLGFGSLQEKNVKESERQTDLIHIMTSCFWPLQKPSLLAVATWLPGHMWPGPGEAPAG